jgi:quercetin dioxygenase-like cupin family protein
MQTLDFARLASKPGDPSYFSGEVTLRAAPHDLGTVKLFLVEFAPAARTHWHTHSGVQLLFVAAGRCRFQHWGGAVMEGGAGEAIYIPAGEKHWLGATRDAPMAHLATNIDLETEWLEEVSEQQNAG